MGLASRNNEGAGLRKRVRGLRLGHVLLMMEGGAGGANEAKDDPGKFAERDDHPRLSAESL